MHSVVLDSRPYCEGLTLVSRGKVRDVYEVPGAPNALVMVATDRISAHDVVMNNGVPGKGKILSLISKHWCRFFESRNLVKTHLAEDATEGAKHKCFETLGARCTFVRKLRMIPLEAVVRARLAGSAWKEYVQKHTLFGSPAPSGLVFGQPLGDGPIFTPTTKAPADSGGHDVSLTREETENLVGKETANKLLNLSIALFKAAEEECARRGIVLADTKFEFGYDVETKELCLGDEVLTPDSSRFWLENSAHDASSAFDKQHVRDFLESPGSGFDGKTGIELPPHVIQETVNRYKKAYELIISEPLPDSKLNF